MLASACSVPYVIVERCDESLSLCDGACVDLHSEPDHCGECGQACVDGLECVRGRCINECELRAERCDGGCVDLASSPFHCGACDRACASSQICRDGTCVDDPCEGRCEPFTETCDGQTCVCRRGMQQCGTECIDPLTDPRNCGECGTECPLCGRAECRIDCMGFPDQCIDSCTDVSSDPSNCGTCGMRCAADSVCLRGQCVRTEPNGCDTCPCEACDLFELECIDPFPYGVPLCA